MHDDSDRAFWISININDGTFDLFIQARARIQFLTVSLVEELGTMPRITMILVSVILFAKVTIEQVTENIVVQK